MVEREEIEVSDDNIMLSSAMERNQVTVKSLALWTGRSQSTIYKYLSGEITIPSVVWRSLYEHTLDAGLITLLTGTLKVLVIPLTSKPAQGHDTALMNKLIKSRKITLQVESLVLDILDDGAVTETDKKKLERFKEIFPQSLIEQYQLYHAITAASSTE
jgi:hypothetical protein